MPHISCKSLIFLIINLLIFYAFFYKPQRFFIGSTSRRRVVRKYLLTVYTPCCLQSTVIQGIMQTLFSFFRLFLLFLLERCVYYIILQIHNSLLLLCLIIQIFISSNIYSIIFYIFATVKRSLEWR